MTRLEQRRIAISVLDGLINWEEYKTIMAAYATVGIFTDFEMLMFSMSKHEELKAKGLI